MSGMQTKERLLNEAVKLFAERGYAETSVRLVAGAAGLNEATIYIYFSGKADILNEILNTFEEKLDRYAPPRSHMKSGGETDGPCKSLCRLLWNYVIKDDLFMRWAFRIVCMEQFTNEKAGALVRDKLHGEVTENIRSTLDELIKRGEIPVLDTDSFASLWTLAMYSSAVMAVNDHSAEAEDNLRAVNERMLDMAVSGKLVCS